MTAVVAGEVKYRDAEKARVHVAAALEIGLALLTAHYAAYRAPTRPQRDPVSMREQA